MLIVIMPIAVTTIGTKKARNTISITSILYSMYPFHKAPPKGHTFLSAVMPK